MKRIRLVHTKDWAIQPITGLIHRIEGDCYLCLFTFWHFAIIKFDHKLTREW